MLKIYDNIELKLLDALLDNLSDAQSIDMCVGYFYLRGWEAKRQAEAAARAVAAGASIPASTGGGESTTTYPPYTPGGAGTPPYEVHEDPMPAQPAAPKNKTVLYVR